MNTTCFVDPISNIGLVNVCHYILSFGTIFNSKGLIKTEVQNQTVPVFNALFQYLHESSNATEAKIRLLRQMNNKSDGDTISDMKYVNETYAYIINEGLFAYYGNITEYLSMRNFAENTNFTALKEIVFDDLLKNYTNNVSCSLGNLNSNPKIDLSEVAIDNLFADYLWPVFKQTTEKNLEIGEKTKLQIHRRLKRQVSDNDTDGMSLAKYFSNFVGREEVQDIRVEDFSPNITNASQFWSNDINLSTESQINDDTDERGETSVLNNDSDSSNLDMYFSHLREEAEVPNMLEKDLSLTTSNGSQFSSYDINPNSQSQARVGSDEPLVLDDSNAFEGGAEVAAVETLWPTFAESNFNEFPIVDNYSSSHSKIRGIDTSTKISGSKKEISSNEDGFIDTETRFSNMTNVQTNRVLGNPGFEIDIDDIPGNSTQSKDLRIERFLESRQNNDKDNIERVPKRVGKKFVYVQTDYAGGKAPVDLIFINMEMDTKSERMQSIANAAVIISSNESVNYTFEDSLKMLKGYIVKLEESEGPVPTYKKLAVDFCENNLTVPNEYNEWNIPVHRLIDDILFEETLFLNGTIKRKEENEISRMLAKKGNETFETALEIYRNSTLLQKSFRMVDFIRLKGIIWDPSSTTQRSTRTRTEAAVYRFAIRECDENTKHNITIYYYRYDKPTSGASYVLIGWDFMFPRIVDFSADEELEISKMNIKPEKGMLAFHFQINLETSCGIPNIDRALEGEGITGSYVIPRNTKLEVVDKQHITFNQEPTLLIKMRYKPLKERRMVQMIKDLYNVLKNNSRGLGFYY